MSTCFNYFPVCYLVAIHKSRKADDRLAVFIVSQIYNMFMLKRGVTKHPLIAQELKRRYEVLYLLSRVSLSVSRTMHKIFYNMLRVYCIHNLMK